MKTPFYDLHVKKGAKIINFHGWDMPLQYSGIIDEHVNTRQNVTAFDVSHMGRFEIKGDYAFDSLESLATNDLSKLQDNQALYSPMCYDDGGLVDDLIIYRITRERFIVVVNASNRTKDFQWIASHSKSSTVEDISDTTALIALQGPRALQLLERALPHSTLTSLKPFDVVKANILDIVHERRNKGEKAEQRQDVKEKGNNKDRNELIISRTGYTGEDGFELLFDSLRTSIWEMLMDIGAPFDIKPAGLGARDTLRLEAGLMLYGNDMNETITPLEIPIKWTVKFGKHDFIGKQALATRPITRKLVGFEVLDKRIARHGNKVFINRQLAGHVTSGSYAPTLKKSIGLCFVPLNVSAGQFIDIDIGGKRYEAKVAPTTRFYNRK